MSPQQRVKRVRRRRKVPVVFVALFVFSVLLSLDYSQSSTSAIMNELFTAVVRESDAGHPLAVQSVGYKSAFHLNEPSGVSARDSESGIALPDALPSEEDDKFTNEVPISNSNNISEHGDTARVSESGIAPPDALPLEGNDELSMEAPLLKSNNTSQQLIFNKSGSALTESSGSRSTVREKPPTASASQGSSIFSACLLIKDDNDILNEWIAYHYHVLNLRNLIVATDPFSETSPSTLLEEWRQTPFNMNIVEWQDKDFMPEYFMQGDYDRVPSFIPKELEMNPNITFWWNKSNVEEDPKSARNLTDEEIEADRLLLINNHRFRQATFVSHCFRYFKKQKCKWVAHIDTDEYVVINPRVRARPWAVQGVDLPPLPSAGSLVRFLTGMYRNFSKQLLRSCLLVPAILFGATENNNATLLAKVPSGWNRTRFESMQWTYHENLKQQKLNGLPKSIVDVSTLPHKHPIFVTKLVKSIHQPLESSYNHWTNGTFRQVCRKPTSAIHLDDVRALPLTLNHYVGSLARYTARQDVRRTIEKYQQKAGVRDGVDDGWIQGWLASFVETNGIEASRRVLGDYYNIED